MLKKINTALGEFTTTISLFQKDRTLTFDSIGTIKNIKNAEAEQETQYKASFKILPELTVVLLGRITESDQRFLKGKNKTFLRDKHDGYGIFTRIDLSFLTGYGANTASVLHRTYKNDRVDPEDTENPARDFRNWPEEMVLSLVSQKLFQKAAEESIRIKKNSLFVEILETMKIEELLENPDPGKCNTIFKSLLSAFEKTATQKMWVDVLENCIQTDIPINEVAAFCLATGRFPKKKELGLEKEKLVIEGPER